MLYTSIIRAMKSQKTDSLHVHTSLFYTKSSIAECGKTKMHCEDLYSGDSEANYRTLSFAKLLHKSSPL